MLKIKREEEEIVERVKKEEERVTEKYRNLYESERGLYEKAKVIVAIEDLKKEVKECVEPLKTLKNNKEDFITRYGLEYYEEILTLYSNNLAIAREKQRCFENELVKINNQ